MKHLNHTPRLAEKQDPHAPSHGLTLVCGIVGIRSSHTVRHKVTEEIRECC